MGVRYQQPQTGVPVDWNHPYLKKAFIWTPFSPTSLAGSRLAGAETEFDSLPVGKIGVGRKWKRRTNAGVDFGTGKLITGADCTILVVAAPAATAAIKVPFSQRMGSGSYQQIDFLFNATGDGLTAAAGNVELLNYDGGSRGVTATSQTDGTPHCWVVSNSTTLGYLYRDGVDQPLTQNVRSTASQAGGTQKIRIGNIADDASTTYPHDDPLYLVIVWDRQLSKEEARSLSANPWQIFPGSDALAILKAAARRGTSVLAGNAAAMASATGALSVAVPLAGAAISVATASGQLTTPFPLSGVAAAIANASGSLSVGIALSGAALAQSIAAGAATVQFSLSVAAVAQATATGNLSVAGSGSLGGNAQAQASASGSLSVAVPLAGNARIVAGASGDLKSGSPLAGAAVAVAVASGNLVVTVSLSGAALAQAIATGNLALQVPLQGAAIAQATARGTLSAGALVQYTDAPAGRGPVVIQASARRPAAIQSGRASSSVRSSRPSRSGGRRI